MRMKSAEKIRASVIAAVLFVLVLGIGIVVILERNHRISEANALAAFDAETSPLVSERQELEIEFANIERVVLDSIGNGSYIGLLFSEIDAELYEVYEYYFKDKLTFAGTMCLSPSAMPGDDGLISVEQFYELTAAGWQYAVYWDGAGDLSEYLTSVRELFSRRGIAFPDTVVFAPTFYSVTHDATLASHGVKNALHHGEEGRDLIDRGVADAIWRPGVLSWNTIGYSNALLIEVINHGGIAFFEMNFSGGHEINVDMDNSERVEGFGRMLGTVQECIDADEIVVTDLATAKAGRTVYLSSEEEALALMEIRRAEIVARMNEIDVAISAIYDKYYG